ncbi:MAG: hypothetical protein VKP72_01960 [bacterium]|nr:hypothetical protein [bacterium]
MDDLSLLLAGHFTRKVILADLPEVSLQELLAQSTHAALDNHDRTLARMHVRHGWTFLQRGQLRNLLRYRPATAGQVPPLLSGASHQLNPYFPGYFEASVRQFDHTFRPTWSGIGSFNLDRDDPRIPIEWSGGDTLPGSLVIGQQELADHGLNRLRARIEQFMARLDERSWLDILGGWNRVDSYATIALEPGVALAVPWTHPEVPGWVRRLAALLEIDRMDHMAENLAAARHDPGWRRGHQDWLLATLRGLERIRCLEAMGAATFANPPLSPTVAIERPELVVERGTGRRITSVIREARQFLIVASFVIEDLDTARMIAQKAREMPGCVFVMCDLKETFESHLEALLGLRRGSTPEIPALFRLKWECLQVLLESPAQVRHMSGHLKAYMNEHEGLFGSANLTPGSLYRNLESMLSFQDEAGLRDLFASLAWVWHHRTAARLVRPDAGTGLSRHDLGDRDRPSENLPGPVGYFLDPQSYEQHVRNELRGCRKSIHVLSYSLSSNNVFMRERKPEQERGKKIRRLIGANNVDTSVKNDSIRKLNNMHAKIVAIDGNVGFLGGINEPGNDFFDLMYRIEDRELVQRLVQIVEQEVGRG